jgi:5-methylcytosine-specific restriction protein B
MLIESDKRGVELQLLYADEQFSIPSNVHIIGMMNTADRSLAMLDYALRRRFAFFEISPAFGSSGFRAYRTKVNNPKFDRLIATVEQLNDVIANDDSLGEGFCIGHSYFCTKATINDEWMKSVVEYELIPLLKSIGLTRRRRSRIGAALSERWLNDPHTEHLLYACLCLSSAA